MGMKVAIPHWNGRVSPVFDVAGNVLVVECDLGRELDRVHVAFEAQEPHMRAAFLAQTGANVLICAAISRQLEAAVTAAGVEVIPQTCGEVEEILAAFMRGQLCRNSFLMPGCGRRRRCCGRRRRAGGRGRMNH